MDWQLWKQHSVTVGSLECQPAFTLGLSLSWGSWEHSSAASLGCWKLVGWGMWISANVLLPQSGLSDWQRSEHGSVRCKSWWGGRQGGVLGVPELGVRMFRCSLCH